MGKRCDGCGRAIRFAVSESGRPMPMEADPVALGTPGGFVLRKQGRDTVAISVGATVVEAGEKVYVSHFASCPQADAFRRKKPAQNRMTEPI